MKSTDITKAYLGSTEAKKIYLGETLIYGGGSSLPYDAEVEYLESTGTQYIDLPLSVAKATYLCLDFDATITYSSSFGSDHAIFGANPYRQMISEFYSYSSSSDRMTFASRVGNVTTNGGYSFQNNVRTSVSFSTTTLHSSTTDGDITNKSVSRPTTAAITAFRLFGGYRTTTRCPIKYHSFKITVGDNLAYNLIPVRVGSVGYMYDKISGELFGNSGSGSFVLGNDI